jgi:hypothetical protein
MEKKRMIHPLWTHLPAVTALAGFLVYFFAGDTLPSEVPVHFNSSGIPNRFGTPWEVVGLMIGLSILFITISVILDELWARQEKKKAFNWLSLMDDIVIGAMAGINLGYLVHLRQGTEIFDFPWFYLGLVGGGTTLLALLLELLRPYRHSSTSILESSTRTWDEEISHRLKSKTPFVFWDYQNPLYVSLISVLMPLMMVGIAVWVWFEQPWLSGLLLVVSIPSFIMYGGLRVIITQHDLRVRLGILGIKVLQLKIADIAAVEKHEFAPLRDFGGYGIRFNREMQAYYLRGNMGVKITTTSGKKYLIGSDNTDRLASVINIVSGKNRLVYNDSH